jgi:IclR family KDG regulon transcriptional repressor
MTTVPVAPSVDRSFAILELLAECPGGLTLSEVARRLTLPRSSAHVLLHTLGRRGYVSLSEEGRVFHLGLQCWALGRSFRLNDELARQALPIMRGIVDELDEIVQLAVRDGTHNVYLAKVDCRQPIQLISRVGMRLRCHATGLGKALLAALSDDEIDRLYASETIEQFTPNTLTDLPALKQALQATRERGFAEDREEYVVGLRCVAVPIVTAAGQTLAAMSISVPAPRATNDKLTWGRGLAPGWGTTHHRAPCGSRACHDRFDTGILIGAGVMGVLDVRGRKR